MFTNAIKKIPIAQTILKINFSSAKSTFQNPTPYFSNSSSSTSTQIQNNRNYLINNLVFCRYLSNTKAALSSTTSTSNDDIKVTFIRANGERITTKGKVGDNLLDVVVNNNIDLDGFGACEGTLTCSTCHLIFSKDVFDKLADKPSDEEMDMLDLAYDLTDTSRLGCQIILSKELNGLEVTVPATINDARA